MMPVKRRYKTLMWLGLGALAVTVVWSSPARLLLDEAFLTAAFKAQGAYAPLGFVVVFTIALALGFPGNVLAVAGGSVFGLVWGTVWSLLGSTLGALGAFCLARYFLQDWVRQRFGHSALFKRLNGAIARYPFNFVLVTRFTPLSPFSLVNFLFGLTPVTLPTYAIATFLGLIPLTLAYSWLGVSGYEALSGGDRLSLYLALGFLTLLTVVPMFLRGAERQRLS